MPKEEKGYWFSTENGTHIHAEEGESKENAMKKKFSKFGKKEETKKDSTFEEINEKRMSGKTKKHDYSEIFDEDYQTSWGIPDFKDENDIKTLNDIVEKAMEYDGEEGAIDISNNAMDRISELVKFSPEEQDKLASGTGEEIMEILRSKENKSTSGYIDFDLDDYLDGKISPEEWEKAKKHNTKLLNKKEQPHLNLSQGHKLSQKELDKETKGMFNSREEGEKFINETKWESEKDKQNAIDRLNRAFPENKSKLDSLYKNTKEKNLDFERSLLNDIKSNPEAYNKIVLGNKEYVRKGNGFDFYENGKHISFGTANSVAKDISDYYEDTETKSNKVEPSKLAKSIKTVDDVKSVFGKYLTEKELNKLDNSKNLYIEISKQYDGDDNYKIIDDDYIKQAFNYGNGTLEHLKRHIANNKDYSHFIKLR